MNSYMYAFPHFLMYIDVLWLLHILMWLFDFSCFVYGFLQMTCRLGHCLADPCTIDIVNRI